MALAETHRATIHASAVAREGSGVLLLGPSGSGKSDLALRLIDRGFVLVGDDRLVLDGDEARPAPALAGLLEVRGLGIVRMPHLERARIALTVDLVPRVERLPAPGAGPRFSVDPRAPSAALKIVLALDCLRQGCLPVLEAGAFETGASEAGAFEVGGAASASGSSGPRSLRPVPSRA